MTVRSTEYQEKVRQEKRINDIKRQKAFLRASAPPYPKVMIAFNHPHLSARVFIQLGRKLMERSRPLDIRRSRPRHSKNIQQEQWIQLLED